MLRNVFKFGSSSASDQPAVLQTVPGDVANTLKTSGPTAQALVDLDALSFPDLQAIRDFMWDVAPTLTGEQLHEVNDYLYRAYIAKNGKDAITFCKSDTLVRLFLTYEAVFYREKAVEHIRGGGAIYLNLTCLETGILMSGMIPLPPAMEEFGTMLFTQKGFNYSGYPDNAAILKSNREDTTENANYLNSIDTFIIKYSVAELDETRKEQADRLMDDGLEGLSAYRGGRKKAVGLSVRHAIVTGEDIARAFTQALTDNNISAADFFESNGTPNGARKYLPGSLYEVLQNAARPSTALGRV